MIGARNSNFDNSTPYVDGKLGGVPWTLVAHSAGQEWTNIGGPPIRIGV